MTAFIEAAHSSATPEWPTPPWLAGQLAAAAEAEAAESLGQRLLADTRDVASTFATSFASSRELVNGLMKLDDRRRDAIRLDHRQHPHPLLVRRMGQQGRRRETTMTEVTRRVAAEGLIVAYAQFEMLRLMTEGATRADASAAAFEVFRELARTMTGKEFHRPERVAGTPTNCLSASAAGVRDAFGLPWETFTARYGPRPGASLGGAEITRLIWLLDTVHRVAEGVPLLDAAREAHDASLGRPRRRRKPAEGWWLAVQLDAAQDGIWWALREQDCFGVPLPAGRPAAVIAEGR